MYMLTAPVRRSRTWVSAITATAVIGALLTLSAISGQASAQANGPVPDAGETICYTVSDSLTSAAPNDQNSEDRLVIIRNAAGVAGAPSFQTVGPVDNANTRSIEAIAIRPGFGIYTWDPDPVGEDGSRFMTINADDASVDVLAAGINNPGSDDVDGLTWANVADVDQVDENGNVLVEASANDELWATIRNAAGDNDAPGLDNDQVVRIFTDPSQPELVGTWVGSPVDIDLSPAFAANAITRNDVDDIAWDPETGQFFVIAGADGAAALLTVNPATGATNLIGPIQVVDDAGNALPVVDVEGLGFSNVGAASGGLFGTTGKVLEENTSNGLFAIDKATAEAVFVEQAPAPAGVDFESMDCVSTPELARIGDRIWVDENFNGIQDPNEGPPAQETVVILLNEQGEEVDRTATTNGFYEFTNVPGNYRLQFQLPNGFAATLQDVGLDDEVDSDVDPNTLLTEVTVLEGGESDLTWDFGIFQLAPGISVEKATNGPGGLPEDADVAPGPTIAVGAEVTWTYVVTNTGNNALTNVTLSDNPEGPVACPQTTLVPGESMTCTLTGIAGAGQYENEASVTGTPPSGPAVTDTDQSHYVGGGSGITVEKSTNGQDADQAPGPLLMVGDPVTWTYVVSNSGQVPLTGVSVSDDVLGDVPCPQSTLAVGESMTCTLTGVAGAGQYTNIASATGIDPAGMTVVDDDPSNYFGSVPGLAIEKSTNGQDADVAPGPFIPVGQSVQWSYVITNNGNVRINDIALTDDVQGPINCPLPSLDPGAMMTCSASAFAVAGQYTNNASVTAVSDDGVPLNASDPSNYFGTQPMITIEKSTNGEDADLAPGVTIPAGDAVTWTYTVTNNGNTTLTNITVSDNQIGPITNCDSATLAPSESMVCTAEGTAQSGAYRNDSSAIGLPVDNNGDPVPGFSANDTSNWPRDNDPSNYFGSDPSIRVEKFTQGTDADQAPGPTVEIGAEVNWTFVVTNTGNIELTDIALNDDQLGPITCPETSLMPGIEMTCSATGTAVAGQYENTATVTGNPPVGPPVTDDDMSHYFGGQGALGIEKSTNGEDADSAPGPYIDVNLGGNVVWTYLVTNEGTETINNIALVDDVEGPISCPRTTLSAQDSMTCTATAPPTAGQYVNSATATGVDAFGNDLSATDPSHYFGAAPSIALEKSTNGEDADSAPGPSIPVGAPVEWLYEVTNTGNVALVNVSVSDNQGVAVTCPESTIAAGASVTCSGAGTAVGAQYTNVGVAIGLPVDPAGTPIPGYSPDNQNNWPRAGDPSNYFGEFGGISIEKSTNGEDADQPTGPVVTVGEPVTWTYRVTNLGNSLLTNVVVADSDPAVTVTCPSNSLNPGDSITCNASGIASAGQYMNTGSVSAETPDGTPVTATDPSHYFGQQPGISVVKSTNGDDANLAPGPEILVGETVTWTYLVSNESNVALTNVRLADDREGDIACPQTTLAVGESMTCTFEGPATIGQYSNLATVSGDGEGVTVRDTDPSNYFGIDPAINIEKFTNGVDADAPTGPTIPLGTPVNWTYDVSNAGNVDLVNVVVSDNDPNVTVDCGDGTNTIAALAVGALVQCTATGSAILGQYSNIGSVTSEVPGTSETPSDSDPSNYFGVDGGLGDRVWVDLNRNGIQDLVEPGYGGAIIELFVDTDGDGAPDGDVVKATTSAADGSYFFADLDPTLSYVVKFTVPNNALTAQNPVAGEGADSNPDPATGLTGVVVVPSGSVNLDVDAGVLPASIGDRVFIDSNSNGIQDAGEPGEANTRVDLYVGDTSGEPIATMNSTLGGDYMFDNLDPQLDYVVVFTPSGRTLTQANAGDNDAIDSDADVATGATGVISVAPGEIDRDVDAGVLPDVIRVSIGDFVWLDVNDNGQQDGSEPGVAGALLRLYVDDVQIAETTSGDNGEYVFADLDPNTTYVVEIVPPALHVLTDAKQGPSNTFDSDFDVMTGRATVDLDETDDLRIDAGLVPSRAAIGDKVFVDLNGNGLQDAFVDTNGNGVQDAGEPSENGVPGVTVTLYVLEGGDTLETGTLVIVREDVTDANGVYGFDDLDPERVYVVGFELPEDSQFTIVVDGNDEINSDPDTAGLTQPITLEPGTSNPTIDAGVLPREADIQIVKLTQGINVSDDESNRPVIDLGDVPEEDFDTLETPINWTYVITNTGKWALSNVVVTDTLFARSPLVDGGFEPVEIATFDACASTPVGTLAIGQTVVCTVTRNQDLGDFENTVTVTADPVDANGNPAVQIDGVTAVTPVGDDDDSTHAITAQALPTTVAPTPTPTATPIPTLTPTPTPVPSTPVPTSTPVPPTPTPKPKKVYPTPVPKTPKLAVTGNNSGTLVAIGSAMMLAGAALVVESRRRRTE